MKGCVITLAKPNDTISIDVNKVSKVGGGDIDKCKFLVPDMKDNERMIMRLPTKNNGTLKVEITCLRGIYHNVLPQGCPKENDFFAEIELKYEIFIERAEKVKAGDKSGKSDPYVVFKTCKSKEKKTYSCSQTLNPIWNQSFRVLCGYDEEIRFKLYDKDTFGKDDLGEAVLKLTPDIGDCHAKHFKVPISKGGVLFVEVRRVRKVSTIFSRATGIGIPAGMAMAPMNAPMCPPQGVAAPPLNGVLCNNPYRCVKPTIFFL